MPRAARVQFKGMYQKRGFWYYQPPKPKGGTRPKPVALKTEDYLEAVPRAVEIRDREAFDQAARKGTVKEALPLYYHAKSGDSADTKRVREMILDNFAEVMGNPRFSDIDGSLLLEWREHLAQNGGTVDGKKGIAASTAKSYLITLRAFLNWARSEKHLLSDPMANLKRHTKVKGTKVNDFLTELEREQVLQPKMEKNLDLILLLGFFAGLRDQEMLAMNPAWIWISPQKDRGTISVQDTEITYHDGTKGVWQPKGRKKRVIPMHERILKWFLAHGSTAPWTVRPDKEKWPNREEKQSKRYDARKAMATHLKRTGVRKLNFHIMRHSFGTHLAMKDVPIVTIAALLGDSIQVAEDHYAGYSPSRKNPLAVLM